MNKKHILASNVKPILKTVTTLAKERGLDPAQLEKEGVEHRFVTNLSGVNMIDETLYDAWVAQEIRNPQKKKSSSLKRLGESDNIGVLRANITRLTDHLRKNEDDLAWLDEDISTKADGIDKKMAQKKRKELHEKIDTKHQLIGDAERRLHFILDRDIGDTNKSIFDNFEENEARSFTDPEDEDQTMDR